MIKKILFLSLIGLSLVPFLAKANIATSITPVGTLQTNADSAFQININELPNNVSRLAGKINFINASATQIANLRLQENGVWTAIPLLNDENGLVGYVNYLAPQLNFKVNFNQPGSYVVGYTITDLSQTGSPTLSSSALPLQVQTGPQVLGARTFNNNLMLGMRNAEVGLLQQILKDAGYFNFSVTDFFGPITLKAVKNFQTAHNIPATGFVGPLTRGALNQ